MRGVWVEGGRVTLRDDLPVPSPPAGWALVAVECAGVCGTDLQILDGYADFTGILGHEFAGRVVVGSPQWQGRRVVGEINVGCGHCTRCAADEPTHCADRRVLGIRGLNGALAEFVVLPERNLHCIPADLSSEDASFAEPLAAAFRVLEQVEIPAASRALVVGAGRLGQLVARALRAGGHAVDALGGKTSKAERLLHCGVRLVDDVAAAYDLAIDCSGSATGFERACAALRPGGTLVLKSTVQSPLAVRTDTLVVNELRVVGSRCGPFAPALEALRGGTVRVDDLVDGRYVLAEAEEALRMAAAPGVIKVLVTADVSGDCLPE